MVSTLFVASRGGALDRGGPALPATLYAGIEQGGSSPMSGMIEQLGARPAQQDDLAGPFAVLLNGEVVHSDVDQPNWTPLIPNGPMHVVVIDLATTS